MLFNAVVVSVVVMVVLSLLRVNVIFALIIAALTVGLMSDMSLAEATQTMVEGMGGQSETSLSYILLGIFAVMIGLSGITFVIVNMMLKVFTGRKLILVFSLAIIATFSQNIIPTYCVYSNFNSSFISFI